MIRGARIVNVALAILLGMIGVTLAISNLGNQTSDIAYRVGRVLGTLLVPGPLIGIFYVTWRGLASDSTIGAIKQARKANIIGVVLFALLLVLGGVISNASFSIWHWLVVLILGLPFFLNIKVLGMRRAELEQSSTTDSPTVALAPEAREIDKAPATTSNPPFASAPATKVGSAPSSRNRKSTNYLVRHWRGELSLGISYWVNGSILAGIVPIVLIALLEPMTKETISLKLMSFVILSIMLTSILVWFWSIVGIWRSADHHVARGGKSGWASAAKVMVVIGILAMAGQLAVNIIPQIKEYSLIAMGKDPLGGVTVKVATNGRSVIVDGMLREGSSVEIQNILDAAPGATALVLNSNGGRLIEAQQLARIVRNRNLDTYVEDQCLSACTYVFLAGKDRAATPNARIGFHQPSFPGLDAAAERAMTEEMMNVYRTAGLPEAFVQRVGMTPSAEMWYPTRDELISARVITRISLGGEATMGGAFFRSKQELSLLMRSMSLYQALEQRFPGTISEAAERGWAVKERGGSDADMTSAIRSVVAEIFPKLLKTVDGPTLDEFLSLMVDEMRAAQAISSEACAKLLASQLDITKTLPKELVEREQKLLMRAMASPPREDIDLPNPAQVQRAIQLATASMPQRYINIVADMKSYSNQPELVCGAMIAFYQGIEALPPRERITALQGIFQSNN